MQVVIRADASISIGTGHVMRCLALAGLLRTRGATVAFLCREQQGNLSELIEGQGFAVAKLQAVGSGEEWEEDVSLSRAAIERRRRKPDLLVVDHYGLDHRWERALRDLASRILVIDDLGNRIHDCDVLLDPNLHDSPEVRYAGLVKASTRTFVGPQYALLRGEFDGVQPRVRDEGLRRVLAFFGGADSSDEALKTVDAIRILGSDAPEAILVLGPIHPRADEVRRKAQGIRALTVLGPTGEMARLMADADLGIGTCGGAAWERCLLGLPSLVVISADNQRDDARILHALGAARNLGDAVGMTGTRWAEEIRKLSNEREALRRMSIAAAAVMRDRERCMRDLETALVG